MQSTTRLHNDIANPILQKSSLVFHHPITLHPSDRVFDTDSDGRDHAIMCFLRWGEFTPRWLFLRLYDRHIVKHQALESHILIEVTPAWEGITSQRREALVMFLAFHGVTQAAAVTGLIDDEQVVDRVALLLAAGVCLLVLWIGWAMDRSRSAILPKRGGLGTPSGRLVASITAQSSALRAGRSAWCAHA
jgi:hypothetical protein